LKNLLSATPSTARKNRTPVTTTYPAFAKTVDHLFGFWFLVFVGLVFSLSFSGIFTCANPDTASAKLSGHRETLCLACWIASSVMRY
jgi:hypothetical protein